MVTQQDYHTHATAAPMQTRRHQQRTSYAACDATHMVAIRSPAWLISPAATPKLNAQNSKAPVITRKLLINLSIVAIGVM